LTREICYYKIYQLFEVNFHTSTLHTKLACKNTKNHHIYRSFLAKNIFRPLHGAHGGHKALCVTKILELYFFYSSKKKGFELIKKERKEGAFLGNFEAVSEKRQGQFGF
jgi:hypothetical protein